MNNNDFTFAAFLDFLESRKPTIKQADELRQVRSLTAPVKTLQKYLTEYRALALIIERYGILPEMAA